MKHQFRRHIFIFSITESELTKRGRRFPFLAKILYEKKCDITYITSNFDHSSRIGFSNEYIAEVSDKLPYNLKVIKVLGYKKNVSFFRLLTHIQFALKSYFYFIKILEPGDIVIIPSRPPELIWVVSLFKKKTNAELVLDISDIWPDAFPAKKKFKRTIFELYCHIFHSKALPKFDKFIFTSPSFINWINRYVYKSNHAYIPLGFDPERWGAMKPKNTDDFKNEFRIFYIGNLTSNIDVSPVIEAIKNNDKFRFTIFGVGEKLPKIQEYVRKNSINNIEFKGFINSNEIPEHLAHQHLSVIPMHLNTMPNKLFDSIAAYLPILVIGENDTSKFVEHYDIGWSLPFNNNKIKDFFHKLNKTEIVKKSRNIAKIRNQFSKESLYNEYIKHILS